MFTNKWILANYIQENGPILTARVSSAQARGAAKKYAYWGAVRYEIHITKDGRLSNMATERASSDRRSYRLAEEDCKKICEEEGRIFLQEIGELNDQKAKMVVDQIPELHEIAYACEIIG